MELEKIRDRIDDATQETEFALRNFIEYLFKRYYPNSKDWEKIIPDRILEKTKEKCGEKFNEFVRDNLHDFLEWVDFGDLIQILYNNYNTFKSDLVLNRSEMFLILTNMKNEIRNNKYGHPKRDISIHDLEDTMNYAYKVTDINPNFFTELKKKLDELNSLGFHKKQVSKKNSNVPEFNNDGIGFYGRDNEKERLIQKLKSYERKIVIYGNGGMGKSSLVQYVLNNCRLEDTFDFDYYIWCTAKRNFLSDGGGIQQISSTLNDFEDLLNTILSVVFEISNKEIDALFDIEKKKEAVELILNDYKLLLIIDNAETILDNEEIMNFLNYSSENFFGLKIIYTCRTYIKGCTDIEIKGLEPSKAVNLFDKICEIKNINEELSYENKVSLVEKVNRNPLAIRWSLSINNIKSGKSLYEIFEEAKKGESDLVKFCFEDIIAQLRNKNPNYLNVLYYIATNDVKTRKEQIIWVLEISKEDLEDILEVLNYYSLLEYEDKEKKIIVIHELAKDYLEKNSQIREEVKQLISKNIQTYNECIKIYNKKLEENDNDFADIQVRNSAEKAYIIRAIQIYQKAKEQKIKENEKNHIIEELKDILKNCQNPEIYIILAKLQSEFETNRNIILEASEIYPNNPRLWKYYGDIEKYRYKRKNIIPVDEKRLNSIDSAIDKYKRALELNSNNSFVYHSLGECYMFEYEGNYLDLDKAIECFEKSIEITEFKNDRMTKNKSLLLNYQSLAETYRRKAEKSYNDFECWKENINKALKYLNLAYEYKDFKKELHEIRQKIYVDAFLGYFKRDSLNESLEFINKIIENYTKVGNKVKLGETLIKAFLYKAMILYKKGKQNEAYLNYEMAMSYYKEIAEELVKTKEKLNEIFEQCKQLIGFEPIIEEGRIRNIRYNENQELIGCDILCKTCDGKIHFAHKNSFINEINEDILKKAQLNKKKLQYITLQNHKDPLKYNAGRRAFDIEITNEIINENITEKITESVVINKNANLQENLHDTILLKKDCEGYFESYRSDRGFGFIIDKENKKIFFHIYDVNNYVNENDIKQKVIIKNLTQACKKKLNVKFDLHEKTKDKRTIAKNIKFI